LSGFGCANLRDLSLRLAPAPVHSKKVSLDRRLTSLLLAEIDSQCRLVLVAEEHLAQAEQMPMRPGISRIEYFWSAVQGIVLGAGNLRNLVWTGLGGRGSRADKLRSEQIADRADMRKCLGVNESSSLRSAVLRNSLEHFDERITDWYRTNPRGSYLTRGLITRRNQAQFASGIAFFGLYERATGDVIFQMMPIPRRPPQLLAPRCGRSDGHQRRCGRITPNQSLFATVQSALGLRHRSGPAAHRGGVTARIVLHSRTGARSG
jgi:hypothetical protein